MKVRKCSVIGCSSVKRNPNISFFKLPKANFSSWTSVINKINGLDTIVKLVCADHFASEDIVSTYSCPQDVVNEVGNRIKCCLKKGAIPSIFHTVEKINMNIGKRNFPFNSDHNYAKCYDGPSCRRKLFDTNIFDSKLTNIFVEPKLLTDNNLDRKPSEPTKQLYNILEVFL